MSTITETKMSEDYEANWHGYNGEELRTERVTLEITMPLQGWWGKGSHPTNWDWDRICDAGDGLGNWGGKVAVAKEMK